MEKLTMHKELEMLREEVEILRKQKMEREKREAEEAKRKEKEAETVEAEVQETAEEIMGSFEEGKIITRETVNELVETIKKDYNNISPASAVLLFALGALLGRVLSSK